MRQQKAIFTAYCIAAAAAAFLCGPAVRYYGLRGGAVANVILMLFLNGMFLLAELRAR